MPSEGSSGTVSDALTDPEKANREVNAIRADAKKAEIFFDIVFIMSPCIILTNTYYSFLEQNQIFGVHYNFN